MILSQKTQTTHLIVGLILKYRQDNLNPYFHNRNVLLNHLNYDLLIQANELLNLTITIGNIISILR